MSENGDNYTAGKNFTLPPAVTALTNSTSDYEVSIDLSGDISEIEPKR